MGKKVLAVLSAVFVFFFSATYGNTVLFSVIQASAETELSEERQTVIDYMTDMAMIKWTAGETFTTVEGGTFEAGAVYYGIPYSQNISVTNSINNSCLIDYDTFSTMLEQNDGLISTDIGRNDCSYAICLSYSQVDSGINLEKSTTTQMRPGNFSFIAVGDYTFSVNKTVTCTYNGEEKMHAAYALLQPGDAVVNDGHTMMVLGVDAENENITVIHQSGTYKYYDGVSTVYADEEHARNTSWGINEVWTFDSLFSSGYIPVTCQALADEQASSEAELGFFAKLLNMIREFIEKIKSFFGL